MGVVNATPAARPAGFLSRLVAFAVDLVVLAAAMAGTSWFASAVDGMVRPWARVELVALLYPAAPFLVAAYFVGLWSLSGQTVGKWLLGLRVVSVDGGLVPVRRGVLRLVGYVLSAIPLYAGFLWILFDPERRTLHDRLARTAVVHASERPDSARAVHRSTFT